jgi:hypothetical protein
VHTYLFLTCLYQTFCMHLSLTYATYPDVMKSYELIRNETLSAAYSSTKIHITVKFQLICALRDSEVGITTSCGLDDRGIGVRVPIGSRIFSSPNSPDRLWGPPNRLSNGYRGLFPRGWSGRGVKLTTHLKLVPRSRKCGSIYPLPYAFMA